MISQWFLRLFIRRSRWLSLLILGTLTFVGSMVLWFYFVYSDPRVVFQAMLVQNLSMTTVDRSISAQSDTSQQLDASRLTLTGDAFVETDVHVTQADAGTINAQVLSTVSQDFVRYLSIGETTPEDVAGVWAQQSKPGQMTQSLSQQVLFGSYFPMVQLSSADRDELLAFAEEYVVYSPQYQSAKKESRNGRSVYVYDVAIQPQTYAQYLKLIASKTGLSSYTTGIDPAEYASSGSVSVKIVVDILSRQLLSVSQASDTNLAESYGTYGIKTPSVSLPTAPITENELQARIAEVATQ